MELGRHRGAARLLWGVGAALFAVLVATTWLQARLRADWHRRRNFIGPLPSVQTMNLDGVETVS